MAPSEKIGYARVSTDDQHTDRQLTDLLAVGVDKANIFEEHASGKSTDRPKLREMIAFVRRGDELYVHSMDRLARNLVDLLNLVNEITAKGVTIHFLKEHLDFGPNKETAPMSKLLLSVMGAVAEFERSLILERQREGIAIAKAKGVYKRKRKTDTPEKMAEAKKLIELGVPKAEAARRVGIGRTTLFRFLAQEKIQNNNPQ